MRSSVGGTLNWIWPDLTEFVVQERREGESAMSVAEGSSVDAVEDEECEVAIPGKDRKLNSAKDVEETVQAIRESEGLAVLRLSGNSMGVRAAQAIAGALALRPSLRRALWSDMFVSRLKSEIPPALTALGDSLMTARAKLVELDLSDNAFGPAGVQAIYQLLTSHVCFSLRVLKLNNTGMGSTGAELLAEALMQCHEEADLAGGKLQLEVFVLGRSRLENEGATALAEVFKTVGSLREVSMPQNGIDCEGISALAAAFAKNPHLRSLDLNDNTFTEEGAAAMAAVLPTLQDLRSINFGDCLIRPGGARAIAAAIQDGHRLLEEVTLGFNELDQSAVLAVADALTNKTELKRLDLNGNCLGEAGVEALRESLEAKGMLEYLGSLSDDEGTDGEGEGEDQEEEEEEREEGEREEGEREDGEREDGEREEEEEQEREEVTSTVEQVTEEPQRTAISPPAEQVSVEDYLSDPSGNNLLALGQARAAMVAASLGTSWSSETAGRLYVKVASCYSDSSSPELRAAVAETLDAVVQPVCEAGHTAQLLNEILVQVGLLKSEDKSFKPVHEVDGPVLALTHLATQSYFPKHCRDILIAFIQKPNSLLTATRPKVLQVLITT